jgi:hypothetical protein
MPKAMQATLEHDRINATEQDFADDRKPAV